MPVTAPIAAVHKSSAHIENSDEGGSAAVDDRATAVVPATAKSTTAKATTRATLSLPGARITWADMTARYPSVYGRTVSPAASLIAQVRAHLPLPAHSGSGRRIVYDGAAQHLWLVASDNTVAADYPVTGRSDRPGPGSYRVYSKSETSYNPIAKVTFTHMVRFAQGVTGAAIGFHSIPKWYNGKQLQTDQSLGLPLGRGGCIRQTMANATFLYNWAPVGTKVTVVR